MKRILLFLILSSTTINIWSQKEGNIWYFGTNAGISFNTSTPVALTNGKISMREGCATISDKNGSLLFYTDGQKVYDNTHSLMPNGSGLLGHNSSCQSAIIVPWPDSAYKYFLITLDAIENNAANGMRYSLIDMRLNGGKGDVVTLEKNIVLIKPQCEKTTLVQQYNKKDFWLLTNQSSSDSMLAFAITSTGINKKAVRSNTGVSLSGDLNNNLGYLNPSHDGSKLVSCHFMLDILLLMDFDNQTGKVSNTITLNKTSAYCAEFSPDNKLLYVSGLRFPTSIDQFDITSNSQSVIQNSLKQIFDYGSGEMGALKLAPDGKIYATSETLGFNTYLGAIGFPNKVDVACSFDPKALYLGGKAARLGLPNNFYFSQNSDAGLHGKNKLLTELLDIYPNPATSLFNIRYSLPVISNVKLKLLNISGEELKVILSEKQVSGEYAFQFETSELPSGVYLIKLETETDVFIKKLMIVK